MRQLAAIILTYNEELHLERCIQSLIPLTENILVVDSFSTDRTIDIAQSLHARVFQKKWKNYAEQFAWAMEQIDVSSSWLIRMDADEYLEPDLQKEIPDLINSAAQDIMGIYLKRKVIFNDQWIKHGGFYPQVLLRIWRSGYGQIEQRWMDEHIVLSPGSKTLLAKGHLVDDNQKGISFWIDKHNKYASREAVDLLNLKYQFFLTDQRLSSVDDPQAKQKRWIKEKIYARLPLGTRAFLYFIYRYFLRLGFLDGSKGFTWHFLQGYWYRMLVDLKIRELEERSGGDIEKMKQLLRDQHGLNI